MLKSCKNWQPYEVRHLGERTDIRGHEARKERYWTVLTDDAFHQGEIFIACPDTSAANRTGSYRGFLVEKDDRAHYVDTQCIWTFPAERGTDDWCAVHSDRTRQAIERKLAGRFGSRDGIAGSMTGKVYWIDLLGPDSRTPAEESDLFALRRALRDKAGVEWDIPRAAQLSCLCVASDEGVPSSEAAYSLATFVPLLHLPNFVAAHPNRPTVKIPADSALDAGQVRVALSQCLFTVDHNSENRGDRKRVYCSGEKDKASGRVLRSWKVSSSELHRVIDAIRGWLLL